MDTGPSWTIQCRERSFWYACPFEHGTAPEQADVSFGALLSRLRSARARTLCRRAGLFEQARPDLGLRPASGTQTVSIFKPGATDDKFNNGVVLIAFKGKLYAQWQSSP